MSRWQDNHVEAPSTGIFAIRGDLDGTEEASDFITQQQFIGLVIAEEEFLLPMAAISEIIMPSLLTFVPGAPEHIEGVINLRGKIIPSINLRTVMGHGVQPPSTSTRMIIAKHEDIPASFIVDGITYVVSLASQDIEWQNIPGSGRGSQVLCGISKQKDRVLGIIDIAKVFALVAGERLQSEASSAA